MHIRHAFLRAEGGEEGYEFVRGDSGPLHEGYDEDCSRCFYLTTAFRDGQMVTGKGDLFYFSQLPKKDATG